MKLEAERLIRAPAEALFDFLADLENHWELAGSDVQVLELTGPIGGRVGGTVRLQGPVGPARIARTRVEHAIRPSGMTGVAELASGTRATVRWSLEPTTDGTRVVLAASVDHAPRSDRVLLRLGGSWWLRRMFRRSLARLAIRFGDVAESQSSARVIKRRLSRFVTNRLVNPVVRPLLERGVFPRTQALLETTGRNSGLPRRVPVGNGLRDGVFWIVTEHGYAADYVKNIERDPRVRVKVGSRWYAGHAKIRENDDADERLRDLGRPVNDAMLRLVSTERLVIRVDLEPTGSAGTGALA